MEAAAAINRRSFLGSCATASAGLSFVSLPRLAFPAAHAGEKRPNIIMFMADDMGWGDVAYHGTNTIVKTPNIDAMSRAGLRLNRFCAASPICTPTRASVLTGRHACRTGNTGLFSWLKYEEQTIAETLRDAGYATGHFGKYHLSTSFAAKNKRAKPDGHGFTEWFSCVNSTQKPKIDIGEDSYHNGDPGKMHLPFYHNGTMVQQTRGDGDKVITDHAITFIEKCARSKKPFMAMVWTLGTHAAWSVSEKYSSRYAQVKNENQRRYWGMVSLIDEQVGRLRAKIRELGIADNTMFWFCSDNGNERFAGFTHGNDPFRGHKYTILEGGLRVPGIIEWPAKITKSFQSGVPVSTVDFYPTVLEACGIRPRYQPPLDGISLLPLMNGAMSSRPSYFAGYHSQEKDFDYAKGWYLVDNQYKLIARDDAGGKVELYDVVADPGEKNNLANKKPAVLKRLRGYLDEYKAITQKSLAGKDYGPTAARHGRPSGRMVDQRVVLQDTRLLIRATSPAHVHTGIARDSDLKRIDVYSMSGRRVQLLRASKAAHLTHGKNRIACGVYLLGYPGRNRRVAGPHDVRKYIK